MSKKRLEEIKNAYRYGYTLGVNTYPYWLISRVDELEQQNKRYRKALEFYADRKTYERRHDPYEPLDTDINDDRGEKARKALEGEINDSERINKRTREI